MAHELEIDRVTQRVNFAAVGPSWHNLGKNVEKAMTAAEAIQEGGVGWEVSKVPAYVKLADGRFVELPCTFGVVRNDSLHLDNPIVLTENGKTVACDYTPLQNTEAFSFFDTIVGEGKARYETIGQLRQGDTIWMSSKLPFTCEPVPGDVVNQYVLLWNTHNGTSSVNVSFTPIRVVCNNTLQMAIRRNSHSIKIRHTSSVAERVEQAGRVFKSIYQQSEQFQGAVKMMAKRIMHPTEVSNYFDMLWPKPDVSQESRALTNWMDRRETLQGLYEAGPGLDIQGVAGTLWAAYNAVTGYVDHWQRGSSDKDARMQRIVWGAGAELKGQAFELATQKEAAWVVV
jgi:phage/plasmid-like protein (TIGR03299 family)